MAPDPGQTAEFAELRPLLFSIAYRILGSVSEAEDAVQETWLRYAATTTRPRDLKAFLSTTITRIAIDVLRSARVRREQYVGSWVPEPLLVDPYEDPAHAAELADSVSMAALLLLERLSPLERAAFVLREVFGFSYAEVAAAVDRSQAACRQLVSRARSHMQEGRPRFEVDRAKRTELAQLFFTALKEGDVDALREMLAADVNVVADGGGKVRARGGALGADKTARALIAGVTPLIEMGCAIETREINGQPGAILRAPDGGILAAWSLDILDGRIQTLHSVNNPDKLGHLGTVGDANEIFHERSRWRRFGST
ncbi:RNA polymerase sigma-70 factor [Nocardioides sp.]|uniref:RNA polymerase sigma-70 factor n=1 Tax=Nocardioides sp. TaxID=35761 RepID=UPI002ED8100D